MTTKAEVNRLAYVAITETLEKYPAEAGFIVRVIQSVGKRRDKIAPETVDVLLEDIYERVTGRSVAADGLTKREFKQWVRMFSYSPKGILPGERDPFDNISLGDAREGKGDKAT